MPIRLAWHTLLFAVVVLSAIVIDAGLGLFTLLACSRMGLLALFPLGFLVWLTWAAVSIWRPVWYEVCAWWARQSPLAHRRFFLRLARLVLLLVVSCLALPLALGDAWLPWQPSVTNVWQTALWSKLIVAGVAYSWFRFRHDAEPGCV
jgi:hypothetical protein